MTFKLPKQRQIHAKVVPSETGVIDYTSFRSIIDRLALELVVCDEAELPRELAERSIAHVNCLRREQPQLSEAEIEELLQVLISGVLARLQQIVECGAAVGSA